MKRLGLPLALALAASLMPQTAAMSGKSSRGGQGGATSGPTSTGGSVATAPSAMKSGPAPTGGFGPRQPCDPKGVFAFGGGLLKFRGGRGFELLGAEQESFLIVEATPGDAQVFLDGRLLGSAGQLIAHALSLSSGRHVLVIVARGFQPYVARFAADPSSPVRIRVVLLPEGARAW